MKKWVFVFRTFWSADLEDFYSIFFLFVVKVSLLLLSHYLFCLLSFIRDNLTFIIHKSKYEFYKLVINSQIYIEINKRKIFWCHFVFIGLIFLTDINFEKACSLQNFISKSYRLFKAQRSIISSTSTLYQVWFIKKSIKKIFFLFLFVLTFKSALWHGQFYLST